MRTLVYALKPDANLGKRVKTIKQLLIDMSKTKDGNYSGLAHLYSLLVESLVGKHKHALVLEPDYIDDLRLLDEAYPASEQKFELGGLFVEPSKMRDYTDALKKLAGKVLTSKNGTHASMQKLLSFLNAECQTGNTVFMIADGTLGCTFEESAITGAVPIFVETPPAVLLEEDDRKEAAVSAISLAISRAHSGSKEPLNLGIFSHVAIPRAMHNFLYERKGMKAVELPIGYSDGSQARSIQMLALTKASDKQLAHIRKAELLHVGQMSDRHPEMDYLLARYFYRNQELSVSRTMAETDEVAYQQAKKIFAEMEAEGVMRIAYYQTGFQPVVIGFYRALIEVLLQSRAKNIFWLEIVPHIYQHNDEYTVDAPWS